jgi:hypothetical protein
LLQLPALTRLVLHAVDSPAAVVEVAAQLTGLKHLELWGLYQLADPALLQLTALTSLEAIVLEALYTRKAVTVHDSQPFCCLQLCNTVSPRHLEMEGCQEQELSTAVWCMVMQAL